jgi:hypothetical protein
MSSKDTDERFTPKKYLQLVKKVYGGIIDLDPASSSSANDRIGATNFYSIVEDGLLRNWNGNIFCNPPYSRGNLPKWSNKLLEQFTNNPKFKNCIFLTPDGTDTAWFHKLLRFFPCCLVDHRISFLTWNGRRYVYEKNPENGSVFWLASNWIDYGVDVRDNFYKEFSSVGTIVTTIGSNF